MSADDEYLAAALHWLRLRLAAPPVALAKEPETTRANGWWRRQAPARSELPRGSPSGEETELAAAEQAMREAERSTPAPSLVRLGDLLGLSRFERHVLLLCAAMELDPGTAARCATAQGDPGLAYPTFALALATLPEPAWDVVSPHRGLRRWRLIEIAQAPGRPLVTSPLRADERIVNYLKGLNELDSRFESLLTPLAAAPSLLPAGQLPEALALHETWDPAVVVQLLGPDSTGKHLFAAAAADVLYRVPADALPADAAELEALARLWSREALLLDAALYIDADECEAAESVTRFLRRAGGRLFLGTREYRTDLDHPCAVIDIARPTRSEQRDAWAGALTPETAGILAGQFDLNLAAIARIAHTVPGTAPDALWAACLAHTRPRLDALAQRIDAKAEWPQLVLPDDELALLHAIAAQTGLRSKVYEDWGLGASTSRGLGVSALFTGPSGTGKSMSAEILARELHLNLYRIDLSAVVSKYIGETEKNLRRLFDAAEEGGALLFFDEADALFGKRSEVRDSHDRYANIEVNYLLQRMEGYRGVAVLATNMRSALDPAFLRRLRFVVTFPFPAAPQRRAIWAGVFPQQTPTDGLDLDRLADFAVTGGTIRNIALNAAFAAAADESAVTMPHVLAAARTEFRKLEIPARERDFEVRA
ncbi:ATP-binding protein [Streptomyces sp. ODS28]|uniref:ATP-binding protein n=1 Tax=Streptomyces sp. ODS28 TaxID=3136688 RepID=UPI0031E69DCD